jgi:hypothetical protein
MPNEVLCKILCHNFCCFIHSILELGIEAKFWDRDKAEAKAESIPASTEDESFAALACI